MDDLLRAAAEMIGDDEQGRAYIARIGNFDPQLAEALKAQQDMLPAAPTTPS